MRTARVLGDIPADRAGALARGIRGEEITALAGKVRQLEVYDARLDERNLVFVIHRENLVHAGQGDDDPATLRNRPTGESGPGPVRGRMTATGRAKSTAPSTEPSYS